MNPLILKKDARFWFAVAILLGTASRSAAESPQYGLDHLLQQTPDIAEAIHPENPDRVSAEELDTPARRHARTVREQPAVQAAPEEVSFNWRAIREEAMKKMERERQLQAVVPASSEESKRDPLEQVRPVKARDRLLLALTPSGLKNPGVSKIDSANSDLNAFRARAASGAEPPVFAPGPAVHIDDFARHDGSAGRSKAQGHFQGYAQPE